MTVVVLPTPPFWLAQAIVWPTQSSARKALTSIDSTIAARFGRSWKVVTPALSPSPLTSHVPGPQARADVSRETTRRDRCGATVPRTARSLGERRFLVARHIGDPRGRSPGGAPV